MNAKNSENSAFESSGRKMSRQEIIDAVTDPGYIQEKQSKTVIIPVEEVEKADFDAISNELGIKPGSKKHDVIRLYCDEKKATAFDAKAFAHRIKNMGAEHLKIVELICSKKHFTAKDILSPVQSIKKIGGDKILALRAFIDLEGVRTDTLSLFFQAALPQANKKEVGVKAYMKELKAKIMRVDQTDVFYNICSRISGITPKTAIALLPKTRDLKPQHTQFVNTFLKEGAYFGGNPIGNANILGLTNLILSLPELKDRRKFERLIKDLSKKPDKMTKDFKYLIHSLKEEKEKEDTKSGSFMSTIRGIFS